MAEDERVPGSTASFGGEPDDSEAVGRGEYWLGEALEGHFDFNTVHPDKAHLVGYGHFHAATRIKSIPFDVDLLVQLKPYKAIGFDAELRNTFRKALDAWHERQPAWPDGLGPSGRALLATVAVLEGLGTETAETLRGLRDRIAELTSATEVPIRALRNPGKVLGELAETGQIARVTSHGKIVGWLMPATEAEQHLDDLLKQGRLRRGTPVPIEPIDVEGLERPLSEILTEARNGERS